MTDLVDRLRDDVLRREPALVLSYAGRRWALTRGESVSIGRASHCTIQLPDDDHISRCALSLRVLDDCVLIQNSSASKPAVLRPPVGEDRVLEPGAGTTSMPFRIFRIVVAGRGGVAIGVEADASALTPDLSVPDETTRSCPTVTSPITFTAAQRRILVELCRPLLTRSGAAVRPADYEEIGQRLGLKPFHVRNVIKKLREELTGHGVPGLTDTEVAAARDGFRWPLARWLVRNGLVSSDDIGGQLPVAPVEDMNLADDLRGHERHDD
ncbi:FHA domain-containing protein [Parafrankia discariae]|uniref:FHA domain-containing protein n=1 Tax=Parafrankia discariae TaxID=365528 RepID=UPI00037B0C7D|nr:FHA domain-containing protein [Parafrankia discariae]